MTPTPWPITHDQLLRPDPETWADVDQVRAEEHEAWLAGELAAIERDRQARARSRRRRVRLGVAGLIVAVAILARLVATLSGRP